MVEAEAQVKDLGKVVRVTEPFDKALQTLEQQGIRTPINARDLAYARIQEGRASPLCNCGSYVREGVLYVPDKTLFIRNSLLLRKKVSEQAVEAHRSGNEFYVDEKFVKQYQEQAEKDKDKEPQKRKVLTLNKMKTFEISTDKFTDEELTLWLFGDQTEDYGNFLRENKINEMPVYLSGNSDRNFANQLWLSYLDGRSYLSGDIGNLYNSDDVRGVLKELAKPVASEKIRLPYTQKQVDRTAKLIQGVREGRLPASKLEKALTFLQELRE